MPDSVTAALKAHTAFTAAKEKVREAEAHRDAERGRLEDAFATAGWDREHAAVAPGGRALSPSPRRLDRRVRRSHPNARVGGDTTVIRTIWSRGDYPSVDPSRETVP
jgi:hypothetical protein